MRNIPQSTFTVIPRQVYDAGHRQILPGKLVMNERRATVSTAGELYGIGGDVQLTIAGA